MTAREKLANYIKSTLGGLSAKHMLEMADASAAEAVAAEREAIRKMIEDIRDNPWQRSALVRSAERETCDRILVELGRRTQPAAQDAAGEA